MDKCGKGTSSLHRHQSSLEGIINFSPTAPLDAKVRAQAKRKFLTIVNLFEAAGAADKHDQYDRAKLVRLTYEYACSEESRDVFLKAFFDAIGFPIDGENVDFDSDEQETLGLALFRFADYLFDNFFLPRMATELPSFSFAPSPCSLLLTTPSTSLQ